ncbi:cell wall synthase accessory phosphoprotein MacP [Enterococcus rivorum]|uniref:Uncharacterized protein n=1 Tax=Enterococcus rivorum TaxID=762845 RepID=A0A1E5KZN9_9ENTE|nr:cell wall synthase accessory phosphoprotein MacP [Enterococcus rivorum]MBP2099248.1 alpha-galactosidase/6-phospho-beta-glucosidase family protein [Enterococcus rivorum]OEH83372.1 hypothetical protein BCR26_09940 [Enterococcus rivorum]
MGKGPLITRSELRKRKEEEERLAEKEFKVEKKAADKEYQRKEKEIAKFYRKEQQKQKPITKSRSGEQTKIRERSSTLNKAIIIIAILLAVVAYIVLNL